MKSEKYQELVDEISSHDCSNMYSGMSLTALILILAELRALREDLIDRHNP